METLERQLSLRTTNERLKYKKLDGSSTWYDVSSADRVIGAQYERTIRQNTPNYWRRLKAGELLPHTPFDQYYLAFGSADTPTFDGRYEYTDAVPVVDRYYAYSNGWAANLNAVSTPHTFFGTCTPELLDQIVADNDGGLMRALPQQAAAGLAQAGFDATTFMAEIAGVRKLFLRTVDTGIQAYKEFNRLERRARNMRYDDWLASVTDAWLTGRYGFRTLLFDVQDLYQLVKRVTGDSKEGRFSTNSASVKQVGSHDEESSFTSVMWDSPVIYRDRFSYELSFRGSVAAEIALQNVDNNLIVTAWEATLLSFVVDWVYTVGNALSAIEFLLRSKQYVASYGYQISGSVRRLVKTMPTPRAGCTIHHLIPPSTTATYVRSVRIPTTVSYVPVVRMNMNAFKGLDAAALLYSYHRRLRR